MNNLSREEQIALIYDKWQKMTITSDPMFGLVMQNKEICLELINRALPNIKAKQIIQLDTQKDINIVSAHRVRFDVYVRDDKNNIIVIEMQVNNQNNIPAMKYELNLMDAKIEAREEGMAKAKREDIKKLIDSLYELNIKPEIIKQKVMEKYNLTDDEYDKFLE